MEFICVLFFFKQKTAYEMVMSDWSSDVCSSDLMIRTYYRFVDVDNDRYTVNGEYRQLMLSPRELSYQNLQTRAGSWINEHLTFTHGYGVVVGPVNRITPEGLPELWVKDIPPQSEGFTRVTRPEIYFGEISNDYVLV